MSALNELRLLLRQTRASKWIYFDGIKIYFRVTFIVYENENIKKSLQLASMEADSPGKGTLKSLLPIIEKEALLANIPILMIENVLTKQLKLYLEKNNWVEDSQSNNTYDVCLYKKIRELNTDDKFNSSDFTWMLKNNI